MGLPEPRDLDPQGDAYIRIVEIAREHCLVFQAAGGVVTIAHPDTQRAEGVYCHVQWVHGKGQHPDNVCRCKKEGNGACMNGNDHSQIGKAA